MSSEASTIVTSAPPSRKPSLEELRRSGSSPTADDAETLAVVSGDSEKPERQRGPQEEAGRLRSKKPSLRGKGIRFWLVVLALCSASFLSALDLTAVSTALPQSGSPCPFFITCAFRLTLPSG